MNFAVLKKIGEFASLIVLKHGLFARETALFRNFVLGYLIREAGTFAPRKTGIVYRLISEFPRRLPIMRRELLQPLYEQVAR